MHYNVSRSALRGFLPSRPPTIDEIPQPPRRVRGNLRFSG